MMRKFLRIALIGFLLFALNDGNAQKIKWGTLQKSTGYFPTILAEDNDFTYVYAVQKRNKVIEKFRKKGMVREYSTEIAMPKIDGREVFLEKINFVGGNFIMFFSHIEKKTKISRLFALTYSGKTGKATSKKIELFDVPVEKKRRDWNFHVFVSPDRSKMLLNHEAYYKKKKVTKDRFKLIDGDLNILSEREETIGEKGRGYSMSNYIIDNEGSIYFYKTTEANHHIVSYDVNRDYEKWEEKIDLSKINMEPKSVITNINFTINSNNDLIVTGYYSKEKSFLGNSLDGCLFVKIDRVSKEIISVKLNEFSKEFREEFTTERDLKKEKEPKIYNNYKLFSIHNKKDGGIIWVGEHVIQMASNYGVRYDFKDLIVMNFSPEGDLLWGHKIPKWQYYSYNTSMYPFVTGSMGIRLFSYPTRIIEYFSFMVSMENDKVHIVFNDDPRNFLLAEQKKRLKKMKKPARSSLSLYSYDLASGKEEKKLFLDGKDFEVYLKPDYSFQKEQGSEVITFGQKGSKFKYGTLTF